MTSKPVIGSPVGLHAISWCWWDKPGNGATNYKCITKSCLSLVENKNSIIVSGLLFWPLVQNISNLKGLCPFGYNQNIWSHRSVLLLSIVMADFIFVLRILLWILKRLPAALWHHRKLVFVCKFLPAFAVSWYSPLPLQMPLINVNSYGTYKHFKLKNVSTLQTTF